MLPFFMRRSVSRRSPAKYSRSSLLPIPSKVAADALASSWKILGGFVCGVDAAHSPPGLSRISVLIQLTGTIAVG